MSELDILNELLQSPRVRKVMRAYVVKAYRRGIQAGERAGREAAQCEFDVLLERIDRLKSLNGTTGLFKAEWKESLHPRDHGRFSSTPGAAGDSGKSHGSRIEHPADNKARTLAAHIEQVPHGIRQKVAAFVKARYDKLAAKFGSRGAKAVLAASVLMLPVPIPFASMIPIALAHAVVGIRNAVVGSGAEMALAKSHRPDERGEPSHDELEQAAREFLHELHAEMGEDSPDIDTDEQTDDEHNHTLAAAMLQFAEECREQGTDPTRGLHALAELEGGRAGKLFKAFDESKHPRDKRGRFIRKEELHAAKADPAKAAELRKRVDPADAGKLEKILSGEVDPGHTKRSERDQGVRNKRAAKAASKASAKDVLNRIRLNREVTTDDILELRDHLPALTVDELRLQRQAFGASWNGARVKAEMVARLVDHAWEASGAERPGRKDEMAPDQEPEVLPDEAASEPEAEAAQEPPPGPDKPSEEPSAPAAHTPASVAARLAADPHALANATGPEHLAAHDLIASALRGELSPEQNAAIVAALDAHHATLGTKNPEGLKDKYRRVGEALARLEGEKSSHTTTTPASAVPDASLGRPVQTARGEHAHEWMRQGFEVAQIPANTALTAKQKPISRFEGRESVIVDAQIPGMSSRANSDKLTRIALEHAFDGYKNSPEFDPSAHKPDSFRDGVEIDRKFADWLGINHGPRWEENKIADLSHPATAAPAPPDPDPHNIAAFQRQLTEAMENAPGDALEEFGPEPPEVAPKPPAPIPLAAKLPFAQRPEEIARKQGEFRTHLATVFRQLEGRNKPIPQEVKTDIADRLAPMTTPGLDHHDLIGHAVGALVAGGHIPAHELKNPNRMVQGTEAGELPEELKHYGTKKAAAVRSDLEVVWHQTPETVEINETQPDDIPVADSEIIKAEPVASPSITIEPPPAPPPAPVVNVTLPAITMPEITIAAAAPTPPPKPGRRVRKATKDPETGSWIIEDLDLDELDE